MNKPAVIAIIVMLFFIFLIVSLSALYDIQQQREFCMSLNKTPEYNFINGLVTCDNITIIKQPGGYSLKPNLNITWD